MEIETSLGIHRMGQELDPFLRESPKRTKRSRPLGGAGDGGGVLGGPGLKLSASIRIFGFTEVP